VTEVIPDTDGRTEPSNAIEDTKQSRWWVHPVTQERFLRVTTALRAVAKDALVPWASYLAARATFEHLPTIISAYLTPECGNSYRRCEHDWREKCTSCPCRECKRCVLKWLAEQHIKESSRRADEGTAVHRKVQHWIETGGWDEQDEWVDGVRYAYSRLEPYVKAFGEFVYDHGLGVADFEYSEAKVINREEGYAGTTDAAVWFPYRRNEKCADLNARLGQLDPEGRVLVMIDTKTKEKTREQAHGVHHYIDHALQLVGYRKCKTLMLANGDEVAMPRIDGTAILQLRPDGYDLRLTVSDDSTYDAFLTAIRLYKWTEEWGPKSISFYAFPLPDEYKRERTNRKARERRAARKTTPAPVGTPAVGHALAEAVFQQPDVRGAVAAEVDKRSAVADAIWNHPDTQAAVAKGDICRDAFCADGSDSCGRTPNGHMEAWTAAGIPLSEVVAGMAPAPEETQALHEQRPEPVPQPDTQPLAQRILGVPPEQLTRFEGRPGMSLSDGDIPF
jgi:hypothetical protein